MADHLIGLWRNLTNADVYKTWDAAKYNPIEPVVGQTGYLDTSPLFNYLLGIMNQFDAIKTRTIVSATDVMSGQYISFNIYDEPGKPKTSNEFKSSAVVASASVPFIFATTNMTDYGYNLDLMDGGVTAWNNNMVSAVSECHKIDGITDDS